MSPRRSWTDEQFVAAFASSKNRAEILDKLGIPRTRASYQALRSAAKRVGADISTMPSSRRTWTDDDLRAAVATSSSIAMVMRTLGYRESGGIHRYITGVIAALQIDTTHFTGQAWNRGRRYNGSSSKPLDEILVRNSVYPSGRLRQRLIAAGLKPSHCEECGLDEWRGKPLPLHLDHINGDHNDHRLANLRILCPNCHSQTDTWCHRNRRSGEKDAGTIAASPA